MKDIKNLMLLRQSIESSKIYNECSICKSPVKIDTDFKDEISKKEYSISGMCQDCQDFAFAETDFFEEEGVFDEDNLD